MLPFSDVLISKRFLGVLSNTYRISIQLECNLPNRRSVREQSESKCQSGGLLKVPLIVWQNCEQWKSNKSSTFFLSLILFGATLATLPKEPPPLFDSKLINFISSFYWRKLNLHSISQFNVTIERIVKGQLRLSPFQSFTLTEEATKVEGERSRFHLKNEQWNQIKKCDGDCLRWRPTAMWLRMSSEIEISTNLARVFDPLASITSIQQLITQLYPLNKISTQ